MKKLTKIFGVGPFGAVVSLALLAIAWRLDRALGHPEIYEHSVLMKLFAALFIVAGLGLHLWTFRTLRGWWARDQLCTGGPFTYFRHPMYAAWITFIALGAAILMNSWIYLLWCVLLQPLWHRLVVREETMMTETFDGEYLQYMKRTGRFIPKVKT
jgi:protein-S-isoprenylcysteine O-methyltransferase Ste14